MTREKTVTVTICDGCGRDCNYPDPCMECGKNFCYECIRTKATSYPHAVHFRGSGDGLFCHPCEAKLMDRPTPMFAAFLKIRNLRSEIESSRAQMELRVAIAEHELKILQATAEAEA